MGVSDRVKNCISQDIDAGLYKPGSRLPTRMTLMKKYNISRATIDKVIKQLQKEGQLHSTQGSGTFVSQPAQRQPHLYIILNTDIYCAEANSFNQTLNKMLSNLTKDYDHQIIGSQDFETHFSEMISKPGCRVIWSRPSLASYGAIHRLDNAGVAQMIVNRPLTAYNFISTDTREALDIVFKDIVLPSQKTRLALLTTPPNLDEPFLMEREIFFHEMLYIHKCHLSHISRCKNASVKSMLTAAREIIDKVDSFDYLFIPYFTVVPYVLSIIEERGLKIGEDIRLITVDWNEKLEGKGLVCITQQWEHMFEKALHWAQTQEASPIQEYSMPEVIVS